MYMHKSKIKNLNVYYYGYDLFFKKEDKFLQFLKISYLNWFLIYKYGKYDHSDDIISYEMLATVGKGASWWKVRIVRNTIKVSNIRVWNSSKCVVRLKENGNFIICF